MTSGAIRTDFILSAEIMVIALNEVADQAFVPRLIILIVVALVITAAVYGVVALIVKMDDIGLRLAQRVVARSRRGSASAWSRRCPSCSRRCRRSARWPCCGWAGTSCSSGRDTLGWHAPYGFVHHLEEGLAAALAWLVNTGISAVIGLVVGSFVVGVVHVLPFGRKHA